MDILTVKQIIQSEKDFLKKNPTIDLMNLAVKNLYQFFPKKYKKKKILIICGPGKNGLDGKNFYKLIEGENKKIFFINDNFNFSKLKILINKSEIIIDSIFGIGLNRDVRGNYSKTIELVNNSNLKVFSFDIPSGIHPDSGKKLRVAIRAYQTLAIGFFKPCHFLLPGKEFCGKLKLIKIGLKAEKQRSPQIRNISKDIMQKKIPKFDLSVHKHKKGHVLVIGGEMSGASRLVALSARKVGAGLSTIQIKKKNIQFYRFVELGTILTLKNREKKNYNTVVIGPGLGVNESKKTIIDILIKYNVPFIIDADIFNIFSKKADFLNKILINKGNCILTPHEGEFKRYFKLDGDDKISLSLKASKICQSIIIFKGNDTVVAFPNGKVWINSNANSNLATAGSGDLLSGIISGFVSLGISISDASVFGVWFHGELSKNSNNLIVEDFLDEIPYVLNSLKY